MDINYKEEAELQQAIKNQKLNEIKIYVEGWFESIECDGVENQDCYMLCEVRNTCTMFNKILEMINI